MANKDTNHIKNELHDSSSNIKDKNKKISKKNILIILGVLIVATIIYTKFLKNSKIFRGKGTIAIIQTSESLGLDAARSGVMMGLIKCCSDMKIHYESIHSDPNVAIQTVRKIAAQKPDAIITIGTMASQVANIQIKDIPIIFVSVTDPLNSGLVSSLEKSECNMTGVMDYINAEKQIKVFKEFMPNLKVLGMIYNPSENNSVKLLEETKIIAEKNNIELKIAAANNTAAVEQAMRGLVENVDAIFINNDNTALYAIHSIIKIADAANKPVFASDLETLNSGVTLAVGVDQLKLGEAAAGMLGDIIKNGANIEKMPIKAVDDDKDIIIKPNFEKLKRFGLMTDHNLTNSNADLNNTDNGHKNANNVEDTKEEGVKIEVGDAKIQDGTNTIKESDKEDDKSKNDEDVVKK